MELRDAVEKAKSDVSEWSLQVTSGAEIDKCFELIAYGDVVKVLVIDFCRKLGSQIAEAAWPRLEACEDTDRRYEIIAEECVTRARSGCSTFFAVGWVMGAPENAAKPKTRETFFSVMRAADKAELRLLEERFASEGFLVERWTRGLQAAGEMVSRIFSEQGAGMDQQTIAQWGSIVSSLPMFEAYELGTRSRMLIEEDFTLSQLADEMKHD